MSFVEVLNRLMQENATSNLALSKVVGVSDTAVGKWRKGDACPSLDNAISIAQYYSISLDELVGNKLYFDSSETVRLPVIGSISIWSVYANTILADDYISIQTEELNAYPREECYAMRIREDIGEGYPARIGYIIFHQQKQYADGAKVLYRESNSDEYLYRQVNWKDNGIEFSAPGIKTKIYRKQDINRLCVEAVEIAVHLEV